MSNLVAHAQRELALIGEDQDTIDSIVSVVQAFADSGQSGGSAPFAIAYLEKLLKFQPLTELTNDPAEWIDQSEISGYPIWQSIRNSEAMSEDAGKTYWLTSEREAAGSMESTPLHTAASQPDIAATCEPAPLTLATERTPAEQPNRYRWAGSEPQEPEPDWDDLTRAQLAERSEPAAAVAAALDEWLVERHGVIAGNRHGVGLFLDLLADQGHRVEPTDVLPLDALDSYPVRRHEFATDNLHGSLLAGQLMTRQGAVVVGTPEEWKQVDPRGSRPLILLPNGIQPTVRCTDCFGEE